MLRYLFIVAVVLTGPQVLAHQLLWKLAGPGSELNSVELRELNEPVVFAAAADCSASPTAVGDIDWGTILTVGERVWQIVEAGKPVVAVQTPVAHALPSGLHCWNELAGWHTPSVHSYEVVYKNGFGMEVVKFRFRVQFSYGGGGPGQYLANVSIRPAELNVDWGYTFDAGVEVEPALNVGSLDKPIAGLELNLHWTVKTVLKESQNSVHVFVQGDGQMQVH